MKVLEAKELAIRWVQDEIRTNSFDIRLSPYSPDGDPGKFMVFGKTVRIMYPRDGFYVQINRDWFSGSETPPNIKGSAFYYYFFIIDEYSRQYYICDYNQIRKFVLDFQAPKGHYYQDQTRWRGNIEILNSKSGYFRWGDERYGDQRASRFIRINNLSELIDTKDRVKFEPTIKDPIPKYGSGGESHEHKTLKEYIANNPDILGLDSNVITKVEYLFCTGDRVDILFEISDTQRAVVEIELSGTENLLIGIHQAIKYRALAASEKWCDTSDDKIKAFVVAFETAYDEVIELAKRYNINLIAIKKPIV